MDGIRTKCERSEFERKARKKPQIFRFEAFSFTWFPCFLVELSRFDSNKYQAILRFKKQLFHHCEKPIETGEVLSINKSVDQFGEIAVKHLQRSFRVEFSDDEVETIISLYKSGKSTNIIAKQFGCAKATISSLLKRHKINVTSTPPS